MGHIPPWAPWLKAKVSFTLFWRISTDVVCPTKLRHHLHVSVKCWHFVICYFELEPDPSYLLEVGPASIHLCWSRPFWLLGRSICQVLQFWWVPDTSWIPWTCCKYWFWKVALSQNKETIFGGERNRHRPTACSVRPKKVWIKNQSPTLCSRNFQTHKDCFVFKTSTTTGYHPLLNHPVL